MCCDVDRADDFKVISSDSHFADFVGVHHSKISQGKLHFYDIIHRRDREDIITQLCKKSSPYIYLDFYIKNKNNESVFVHCFSSSAEGSTISHLVFADVSRSERKTQKLKTRANALDSLVDFITAGVCVFKVDQNMHFEALYMNEACCRFFGTEKAIYKDSTYRLDDLIHPNDKSAVFQAVGRAMAAEKPIDMLVRILTHKDEALWCRLEAAVYRYEGNCPVFQATLTDISDFKK